jgi:predicted porin
MIAGFAGVVRRVFMRKLLMATAAIMGATGGLAYAQTPANPSQGQLAAPYGAGPANWNNNNAWGIANTPSGSAAAGPLSTIYAPNVDAVPAPGTVVIRLNGRVEAELAGTFSNLNNSYAPGYKLNPVGISSYVRLYPGFDGLAANGLRYGASVEIRENFYGSTTTSGANSSTSGNISAQTLFVRAAFTYLATDQAGIVRLGQGSGVLSLFDNCIFTTQCWDAGLGTLNGAGIADVGPSNASIPFVWINQAAAEVGNNKIVYLSPQFFGLDFGLQYAPSEGNAFSNGSGTNPLYAAPCVAAGPSCINLSSGNDASRWYNQVGGGLRYQQNFGAVDFKVYGFGETAQKDNLTTGPYVKPSPTSGTAAIRYDNLAFYKAGTAITFANFTAALDYIGGAVNGQLQLRPTGGANMNAVLPGLTYANGPIVAGAEFGDIWSQGSQQLTGLTQRHEYEFALGGSYKLAPGVQLVGEYQYAYRHQSGFNFATNEPGNPSNPGNTVNAQTQQILFSTVLTW